MKKIITAMMKTQNALLKVVNVLIKTKIHAAVIGNQAYVQEVGVTNVVSVK